MSRRAGAPLRYMMYPTDIASPTEQRIYNYTTLVLRHDHFEHLKTEH